ncbi:protein vein isoform X2 [Cephus cinctus]|uniref:Protein vein isoform X2 n=1 Tax=Cephus cinctus TaxID=211228 RepID=A0AAJ7CAS7_CEPCN|nr:protein vein isoform X2 [Cephus cinctus]
MMWALLILAGFLSGWWGALALATTAPTATTAVVAVPTPAPASSASVATFKAIFGTMGISRGSQTKTPQEDGAMSNRLANALIPVGLTLGRGSSWSRHPTRSRILSLLGNLEPYAYHRPIEAIEAIETIETMWTSLPRESSLAVLPEKREQPDVRGPEARHHRRPPKPISADDFHSYQPTPTNSGFATYRRSFASQFQEHAGISPMTHTMPNSPATSKYSSVLESWFTRNQRPQDRLSRMLQTESSIERPRMMRSVSQRQRPRQRQRQRQQQHHHHQQPQPQAQQQQQQQQQSNRGKNRTRAESASRKGPQCRNKPCRRQNWCPDVDVGNRAFLAPTVFEGKVRSMSSARKPDLNYSVTFEVKQVYKSQSGFQPLQKNDNVRLHFRNKTPGKSTLCSPEVVHSNQSGMVRANIEKGKVYLVFVNRVGPRNFTILGEPVSRSKKNEQAVQAVVRPDYVEEVTLSNLNDSNVKITDTVRLVCRTSGSPPPRVHWLKDGLPLHPRRGLRIQHKRRRSKVVIKSARLDDSGRYECVAESTSGHRASLAAELRVLYDTSRSPETTTAAWPRQEQPCPIAGDFCMNGGTCLFFETVGEPACRCAEGYTGQRCERKDVISNGNMDKFSSFAEDVTLARF